MDSTVNLSVITELRVTIDGGHVRHDVSSSRVRKHRLGNDDVPFIKIKKKRGTQTDDGAPNREH